MSQWTHICGCIRFDRIRMLPNSSLQDIKNLLGNTVNFEDLEEVWDKCNVPCGSEGSIQFHIWENPHPTSLAAYTVSIFGDLRDFGSERISSIRQWFERITNKDNGIRNAILQIEVEYGPTFILYCDTNNDNKIIEWKPIAK